MVNYTDNSEVNASEVIENLQIRLNMLEDVVTKIGYESKATEKNRFKKKRQSSVLYGITKAICVETIDPWKQNRVRFYHPLLHDPKAPIINLPFANPVSAMGGFDDCGLNWIPPAGSTLMIFFEGGVRDAPYYIGTTWHRNRGTEGREFPYPFREWSIYSGHRHGYFHGPGPGDPNDGHQVLPPWNTENYNGLDIDRSREFIDDPDHQKRVTFPNIYGFKTPEKHMLKMVDGDAKCNRRWKRIEIMSGCGNWMIMKDDHLHHGGQWAHPTCAPRPGGVEKCAEKFNTDSKNPRISGLPYHTDILGKPIEGKSQCAPNCEGGGVLQCEKIIGGHSETPGDVPDPSTKYAADRGNAQTGSNINFKHKNECRPYHGPGTPQNNKCDLPQSGIQFLSISGHTLVMDDSVEEPRYKPEWERSLQPFDFGCNNKYLGVMFMKSGTGHAVTMSDVEEESGIRGWKNFMEMRTGNGSFIQLNDETIKGQKSKTQDGKQGESECQKCPPDYAGPRRGVHIMSTSNHQIRMIDHMNLQCGPCRAEGGIRMPLATKAYIKIRSGYGLEMRYNDDYSQQETQEQWIQIFHPQCVDPDTDKGCNSCKECHCRGPHILRFQGRPKGEPGVVFLRAGGHAIRQTYDQDIVIVGDPECNPSDKFTYVSKKFMTVTEDVHFRYSGELHILFAEKQILLMAGRDCFPTGEYKCCVPCLYNVIVARCPVFCPYTKILHWTEKAMSERVFASAYRAGIEGCPAPSCGGPESGKGCREAPGKGQEKKPPVEEPMLPTS